MVLTVEAVEVTTFGECMASPLRRGNPVLSFADEHSPLCSVAVRGGMGEAVGASLS